MASRYDLAFGSNSQLRALSEVYASSDGSEKYNEELSLRRAVSVKNYLIQQGVSEERIITSGFGENDPSGDNETVEGRTVNRRVQFKAKL